MRQAAHGNFDRERDSFFYLDRGQRGNRCVDLHLHVRNVRDGVYRKPSEIVGTKSCDEDGCEDDKNAMFNRKSNDCCKHVTS